MSDDEATLRKLARDALEKGVLPGGEPHRTWGGPGSGGFCAVCERPIERDQTEFELQFGRDDLGEANPRLHLRCFAAWEFERQHGTTKGSTVPCTAASPAITRASPRGRGLTLPAAAGRGIITGHERGRTPEGESE